MSFFLNFPNTKRNRGQALLIAVVFFMIISATIAFGLIKPIVTQIRVESNLSNSRDSYFLAEAGVEDVLYRIKNGVTVSPSENLSLNGDNTQTTVTTTTGGKTITGSADANGFDRKVETKIITGVGAAFNYGVQSGTGGFVLAGGSRINGNVYSNGTITATNGVTITGSAIAANPIALTSDQSNTTPVPISSCTSSTCITFGNASASQDIAESFYVSQEAPLNSIAFYIKKVSTPADITVKIVTDNAGSPSSNTLLSGTIGAGTITTNFGWVTTTFPSTPILDSSQTYWIVLDAGQNSSKYYIIGSNTLYSGGQAKIGQYGGSWANTTPAGLDIYFQTYLGGGNSTVGGGSYVGAVNIGSAGVGDAWAHNVAGANVAGSLYCQTGSNNNKSCNTSRSDPPPQGFPISDANIAEWKDEATTTSSGWTYQGNLTIGYQGTTTTSLRHVNGNLTVNGGGTADIADLEVNGNISISGGGILKVGPLKVNGNLTVGSNSMTVKGTVWVTGTVTVSSGATVRLDTSYGANSGVVLSDGIMDLSGGGNFYGSGQATSYPLLITTSDCPVGPNCSGGNAISFSGGAGAVILNAQNGTLSMVGGTNAQSLAANQITVDNGGTITYNSGLANINFSSGPSGGWNVTSWKEIQ